MKYITLAAFGAALSLGFGGLTTIEAQAGGDPPEAAYGCPKGGNWNLTSVGAVIPDVDVGNYKDQNGDGLVCQFSNPNKNPSGIPDWVVKDNTKKSKDVPD